MQGKKQAKPGWTTVEKVMFLGGVPLVGGLALSIFAIKETATNPNPGDALLSLQGYDLNYRFDLNKLQADFLPTYYNLDANKLDPNVLPDPDPSPAGGEQMAMVLWVLIAALAAFSIGSWAYNKISSKADADAKPTPNPRPLPSNPLAGA